MAKNDFIINGENPAMPLDKGCNDAIEEGYGCSYTGLTKREHFAAMAMQGMCAAYDLQETELSEGGDARINAKLAVEHADALLAALEKS